MTAKLTEKGKRGRGGHYEKGGSQDPRRKRKGTLSSDDYNRPYNRPKVIIDGIDRQKSLEPPRGSGGRGGSDEKIHKKPHATREGSRASVRRASKRFDEGTYKIGDYGDKSLHTQWKAENKARKQKRLEKRLGGPVTRFRSSGPEGKPHSTKEGRSAEAQRAYMRKHGPQEPRRKRLQREHQQKKYSQELRTINKATGGRIGLKSGASPKGWFEKLGGSEKAKPHSTREGRVAAGRRRIRRILKAGDKPKPRPKDMYDNFMDQYKKHKRDKFRKDLQEKIYPKDRKPGDPPRIVDPRLPRPKKDRIMTPLRAKKSVGGRIGLQHGNRPRPQGPHTWVKSGGAVLKGKKVGIQIK